MKKTLSMLNSRTYFVLVCLFIVLSLIILNFVFFSSPPSAVLPRTSNCHWQEGFPILYTMKTKLGVSYEGGHWFHVAENYLTQHSLLRQQADLKTDASEIFFNFDKVGFVKEMNGVTKLMVLLGAINGKDKQQRKASVPGSVSFMNNKALLEVTSTRSVGENLLLEVSPSRIPDLVHENLSPKVPTPTRFLASVSSFISDVRNKRVFEKVEVSNRSMVEGSVVPKTSSSVTNGSTATTSDIRTRRRNDDIVDAASSARVCVKYMGTLGGVWPTVQRGHWFPNAGDVETFRAKIAALCPQNATLLTLQQQKQRQIQSVGALLPSTTTSRRKMVIYQRDLSRKLLDQNSALKLLKEKFPTHSWEIKVLMHKTHRSPCELAHILHDADVLLTPHGFQSMLLIFLPRPAVLFEIFPYKYYKRGYGPFGNEYGIVHGGVMSPPVGWAASLVLRLVSSVWCMRSKMCRGFARSADVRLTPHAVNRLARIVNSVNFADKDRDYLYER